MNDDEIYNEGYNDGWDACELDSLIRFSTGLILGALASLILCVILVA